MQLVKGQAQPWLCPPRQSGWRTRDPQCCMRMLRCVGPEGKVTPHSCEDSKKRALSDITQGQDW